MAIKIQGDIVIDDSENLIISGSGNFNGTGFVKLPAGTTGQRPTSPLLLAGNMRYNTSLSLFEIYNGTEWFTITGSKSNGSIVMNRTTATESYSFTSGLNGFSVGPVTINAGVSITVPSGQRWVVI
jgi:hypothetical protein